MQGKIEVLNGISSLELIIPKSELEYKLNQYWTSVIDSLPQNVINMATTGGYREPKRDRVENFYGGRSEFYKTTLSEVVEDYLNSVPNDVLTFDSIKLHDGIQSDTITAVLYMAPDVTWKSDAIPGISSNFKVEVPQQPSDLKDKILKAELETLQLKHEILVPKTDPAADGDVLVVSSNTSINGSPWEPGTFKNNKWLLRKDIFLIPEMYSVLIGSTADARINTTVTLPETVPSVGGKTAQVELTVHSVFSRSTPVIDDDLAKSCGFETLAQLTANLEHNINKKLEDEHTNLRLSSAMSQLLDPNLVDVGPVPMKWVAFKAKELYQDGITYAGSEDILLGQLTGAKLANGDAVNSRETAITYIAQTVASEITRDLILRSWGKKKGLPGHESVNDLDKYMQTVHQAILQNIDIVEMPLDEFTAKQSSKLSQLTT